MEELINMIDNLKNFLDNLTAIHEHPYSEGLKMGKVLEDLKDYTKDLKEAVISLSDKQKVEEESSKDE